MMWWEVTFLPVAWSVYSKLRATCRLTSILHSRVGQGGAARGSRSSSTGSVLSMA